MFKQIVLFIVTAILIIGCGTPEDLGTSKVNVTENPVTEVSLPPASSSSDKCGNAYYPIVDGAQWNYTGPTGPFTHRLTVETGDEFTIVVESGADTFIIRGLCLEGGDINLLQVPGTSLSYSGDNGSSSITTTSNEGVTLPGDIQAGDDWSQTIGVEVSAGSQKMDYTIDSTFTAVGYETVTVPAGTFNALNLEESSEMGGSEPTIINLWYVQNVGSIKTEIEMGDQTLVNELVSYNIP